MRQRNRWRVRQIVLLRERSTGRERQHETVVQKKRQRVRFRDIDRDRQRVRQIVLQREKWRQSETVLQREMETDR